MENGVESVEQLNCPHAGCKFTAIDVAVFKKHLMECPFGMKEYINEFLRRKEQQLAKDTSEQQSQQLQHLRQVLNHQEEQVKMGQISASDSSEYLNEFVHTSKHILTSVGDGIGKINKEYQIANKTKEVWTTTTDTVEKTKQAIVDSETWKRSWNAVANTTDAVWEDLKDTGLWEELKETVVDLKQELLDSLHFDSRKREQPTNSGDPPIEEQLQAQLSIGDTETKRGADTLNVKSMQEDEEDFLVDGFENYPLEQDIIDSIRGNPDTTEDSSLLLDDGLEEQLSKELGLHQHAPDMEEVSLDDDTTSQMEEQSEQVDTEDVIV